MPWLMAWLTVPRLGTLYGADPHSTSLVALFGLDLGCRSDPVRQGDRLSGHPRSACRSCRAHQLHRHAHADRTARSVGTGYSRRAENTCGSGGYPGCIILFALAGSRKEQSEGSRQTGAPSRSRFRKGLVICLLAGIFGPMINFAFVYGAPLQQQAVALGADPVYAGNAVWSVALTAGFLINAAECIRLFRRNRTWKHCASRRVPGITLAAVAGNSMVA
ncbi:MAG: L-rhamnose/proton symporter RhaT [Alistipes onderdonkii]